MMISRLSRSVRSQNGAAPRFQASMFGWGFKERHSLFTRSIARIAVGNKTFFSHCRNDSAPQLSLTHHAAKHGHNTTRLHAPTAALSHSRRLTESPYCRALYNCAIGAACSEHDVAAPAAARTAECRHLKYSYTMSLPQSDGNSSDKLYQFPALVELPTEAGHLE